MDDALDINPSQLSDHMENQMNLFTMEHEEEYGDLMNELIEIFIPPENATREELEEARKIWINMQIIARIFPLICSRSCREKRICGSV